MENNNNIEKQPLIKGCFHSDDAREIINNLFQSKILYHSVSSLRVKERTGGDSSFHAERIEELSKSLKELYSVIDYASKKGYYLNINCNVKITLTDMNIPQS